MNKMNATYYKEKIKDYYDRMTSFLSTEDDDKIDIKIACAGYLSCLIDNDLLSSDYLNEMNEWIKTL